MPVAPGLASRAQKLVQAQIDGQPLVHVRDGIVRGWFDGKLVVDRTDVVLRSTDFPNMKFNQYLLTPYFGPGLLPQEQTLWIDELVVATDRLEAAAKEKSFAIEAVAALFLQTRDPAYSKRLLKLLKADPAPADAANAGLRSDASAVRPGPAVGGSAAGRDPVRPAPDGAEDPRNAPATVRLREASQLQPHSSSFSGVRSGTPSQRIAGFLAVRSK